MHPGEDPPLITPEHGYHVLEIMIKAKESGQAGQSREIESTFIPPSYGDPETKKTAPHLIHDPGARR